MSGRFNLRKATIHMAFLAMLTFTGACSDNPMEPTSAEVNLFDGEVFTYRVYRTDTAGNVVLGSEQERTVTVTETGMTMYGKSDVVAVHLQGRTSRTYLHYETNGDVSIAAAGDNSSVNRWVSLPFASRTTSVWSSASGKGNDGVSHKNIGDTAWYAGEMSAGFGPQRQNCVIAGYVYTVNEPGSTANSNGRVRMEEGYWFARNIGFFPKMSFRSLSIDSDGNVFGGETIEVWELQDRRVGFVESNTKSPLLAADPKPVLPDTVVIAPLVIFPWTS